MEKPVDIDALDAEVVRKFGWTSASALEELYTQLVNSYLNLVLDNESFLEYADPFLCNELRCNNHSTIASAWNIPRKLVSIALELVCEEDGHRTDCFNLYVKTKDMNFVKRRFLDRLAEIRYEFYVENKHWELVDRVGNTWVEKGKSNLDLDSEIELGTIPNMHQ